MDSSDRVMRPTPETTFKSVTMFLPIFSNVEVVISTMTKTIVVITTQRQTQQNVLSGQTAIKQIHSWH